MLFLCLFREKEFLNGKIEAIQEAEFNDVSFSRCSSRYYCGTFCTTARFGSGVFR